MKYVESLRLALDELLASDSRVHLIGEDILDPYGGAFKVTKGLSVKYPDRVIGTPISEAGLTGVGIGLSMRGMLPIVEIMFGDFLTLAADQIINSAAKFGWMYNNQVNVPIVIRVPMGGYRGYGPTHSQSLEAMFLSIPNVNIVSPSIYHSPGKLLKNSLRNNRPTLFVEHKCSYAQELVPSTSSGIFEIELLESIPLFPTVKVSLSHGEPADITLISYGYVSAIAVKVAYELFMEEEIIVDVLIASSIKPMPILDFMDSIKVTGKVLTVEEGVVTGSWGAELSSIIHETCFSFLKAPVVRVGAKDVPIPSSKNMEIDVLPSELSIKNAITKMLS